MLIRVLYQNVTCLFLAKNVAADISEKLCESVAAKLEGKVLGTFGSKCDICLSKGK